MQDNQKIIQFLELLLNDLDCVAKMTNDLSVSNVANDTGIIHILSRLNSLHGKISGAKQVLEWTQEKMK